MRKPDKAARKLNEEIELRVAERTRTLQAELERVRAELQAAKERYATAAQEPQAGQEIQKLASLVENSTDFIGVASPAGPVQFVNAAGQKLLGMDGDEQVRTTEMLDYVAE